MQHCRRKALDKIVSTDRQTAMAIPVYPPPLCCGEYKKFPKHIENSVGKGEIARYEYFFLFPTVFSKDLYRRYVKTSAWLGKGKSTNYTKQTFSAI